MTERREERAMQSERRDDVDAEDVAKATVEGFSAQDKGATENEAEEGE